MFGLLASQSFMQMWHICYFLNNTNTQTMSDKSGTRHCEVWVCTDIISMWSFDCGRRKEVKNKEKLRYGVWNRWFAWMSSQTAQSHRLPPMQILCQHAESHLANVPQKKHRWPPVSLCRGLACQESDFKWQCVHTWAQAKDFCIIVCTFSLSDLPKLHISARTVVLLEYRPFSTHWYSKCNEWTEWTPNSSLIRCNRKYIQISVAVKVTVGFTWLPQ